MMGTDERLDESISSWLAQAAPGRLPDRTLEATFERTRRTRQQASWRGLLARTPMIQLAPVLGGVAVVIAVVAILASRSFDGRPGVGGPAATPDPRSAFLGTWVSTSDADGGTQTMTVRPAQDGAVEIVVTDDVASVCSGTPSTMTGTGRLEGDARLVIPAPAYTCDDGSEPEALSGLPLVEQLRNMTYVYDARAGVLTVGGGSVWTRPGAAAPSPSALASGPLWPQSSLEEVRRAQALADAGDPAYAWQVDPGLSDRFVDHLREPGAEIAERFLREELGWDKFLFQDVGGERAADGIPGVLYVRCGPGETDPLYPDAPVDLFGSPIAEPCTPSIDELRYETVSLDLAQPGLAGPTGIWVVSGWRPAESFAQADPEIAKAEAQAQLEAYLQARVEGKGAEGGVFVQGTADGDMPLLYATTAGASYERYEIERVSGPTWPYGSMVFNVRLFADGGKTVVGQQIEWSGGLSHSARNAPTTENGQPVAVPLLYGYLDGEVTLQAADPWIMSDPSANLNGLYPVGRLIPEGPGARPTTDGGERSDWDTLVLVADPKLDGSGCEPDPDPADARSVAESLRANPDLRATAPVAVSVGQAEGLVMDVRIASGTSISMPTSEGGDPCPNGLLATLLDQGVGASQAFDNGVLTGRASGEWMRLYLVDAPGGSSMRTLAVAIVAPESRFERAVEAAKPVVNSIEFHAS